MQHTQEQIRLSAINAGAALQHLAHEHGKARGEWRTMAGNDLRFEYRKVIDSHKPDANQRYKPIELPRRNIPELICAVHADLSEAFHGARLHKMDDRLPRRPAVESNLAKAVVRIFDIAGGMQLDLPGAIADQMRDSAIDNAYKNQIRAIYAKSELDAEFKRLMRAKEANNA